jgi:hypothetical protein
MMYTSIKFTLVYFFAFEIYTTLGTYKEYNNLSLGLYSRKMYIEKKAHAVGQKLARTRQKCFTVTEL